MAEAETEYTSPDVKWSIDDAAGYLTSVIGLRDEVALSKLTDWLVDGRLPMHWVRTDLDGNGQQGNIPAASWRLGALGLNRDHYTDEQCGPIDFATGKTTAKNDGRVFVQALKSGIQGATYELTVSKRTLCMLREVPELDSASETPAKTSTQGQSPANGLIEAAARAPESAPITDFAGTESDTDESNDDLRRRGPKIRPAIEALKKLTGPNRRFKNLIELAQQTPATLDKTIKPAATRRTIVRALDELLLDELLKDGRVKRHELAGLSPTQRHEFIRTEFAKATTPLVCLTTRKLGN
jgi:hypothetical protein